MSFDTTKIHFGCTVNTRLLGIFVVCFIICFKDTDGEKNSMQNKNKILLGYNYGSDD